MNHMIIFFLVVGLIFLFGAISLTIQIVKGNIIMPESLFIFIMGLYIGSFVFISVSIDQLIGFTNWLLK